MFRNYLAIAWRILLRQRVFSAINIMGLAVGMAACLLIVEYMRFELSYDDFHLNGDQVYRIRHHRYSDGVLAENLPMTYSAVGPVLKQSFPAVVQQTRVSADGGLVSAVQPDGHLIAFNEPAVYFTEGSFLRMFSFQMIEGTRAALDQPNGVVVTESTAKKYFPGQTAIGKTLQIQQQVSGTNITAMVTGICKDLPANSHMKFDFLVSQDLQQGDWVSPDSYTYVQLAPGVKPRDLERTIASFLQRNIEVIGSKGSISYTQGKSRLDGLSLGLQPLTDIHLSAGLAQEMTPGVNGRLVWFLGIIALLILMIAYINYLNLSTAKVVERVKEVGIRKVLGSARSQLVRQFLLESLILNVISLAAAIGIAVLCMPWFSRLCGVAMHFTVWRDMRFVSVFAGLLLLGLLISALYPALVLSAYKPVEILKGRFVHGGQGIMLRKTLVVFQFTATVAFIAGTLIVYRQVNYMQTADKGMDMRQTLVVVAPKNLRATDADAAVYAHKDTLLQSEILRSTGAQRVTSSSSIPGQSIGFIMQYTSHPRPAVEKSERLATMEIGSRFISQFNMKVVAGDSMPGDAWNRRHPVLLLNEAAVTAMGFKDPQEAIGKLIQTKNGRGRVFENEVIGVTKNFHQGSLKEAFTPMVFRLSDPSSVTYYEVKVNAAMLPQAIAGIGKTYKSIFPSSAFEYFFLDDFFNRQYKAEQHFGQVFGLFAGLAIFVACMGLFGLTVVMLRRRVKEIGIRKVLGASVADVLALIGRDLAGLLVIANLIALPIVYWGGRRWLEGYAFRIDLSWWLFVVPAVVVLMIALVTVSQQAIRAALANPVKSLRAE